MQIQPVFLAVSGLYQVTKISTPNFGPSSTKLGGTVQAIKKMTHNDNGPCPGRNYRKTAVFTFGQKVFFGPKMHFIPNKHPKFLKELIFILQKGTFSFAQLFPVVARTWLELRSLCFLGPKISVFSLKIRFLPYDPNFWSMACLYPSERLFPTLGRIFRLFVPALWPFS